MIFIPHLRPASEREEIPVLVEGRAQIDQQLIQRMSLTPACEAEERLLLQVEAFRVKESQQDRIPPRDRMAGKLTVRSSFQFPG